MRARLRVKQSTGKAHALINRICIYAASTLKLLQLVLRL